MNLIKGIMILSFGAITLSATWFVGGYDLGEMPQKREFVSISNGGDLDDSQAMRDGVGVRLFGMGSEATPSFREMNALLLSAAPGEVVKDRDDAGDMFVRLPPNGAGESPVVNNCTMSRSFDKIFCGDCNIGDSYTFNFGEGSAPVTYTVASEESLRAAIQSGSNLSNLCTSKITNMSSLFEGVSATTAMSLSSMKLWDTSNVLYMDRTFKDAQNVSLDIWDPFAIVIKWDVSSVVSACQFASGSDLSSYDFPIGLPESITCLSDSLNPIDDAQNGPDNSAASCPTGVFSGSTIMCGGCAPGTSFEIELQPGQPYKNVIVSSDSTIFGDITASLQTGDYICTSNLTSLAGTFSWKTLTPLQIDIIEKLDTSSVSNFNYMLKKSTPINSLSISNWDLGSYETGCSFALGSDMPESNKRDIHLSCSTDSSGPS